MKNTTMTTLNAAMSMTTLALGLLLAVAPAGAITYRSAYLTSWPRKDLKSLTSLTRILGLRVFVVALVISCLPLLSPNVAFAQRPENELLSFNIGAPIKPDSTCIGDGDADADWDWDCLDDARENTLAWWVNPKFAWDEQEDCNFYNQNTSSWAETHEKPRVYVQVRPAGSNVASWKNDNTYKWVWVAFYFLHPIDCQSSGHIGDTEKIYARLYTKDLQTFFLDSIDYMAHSKRADNVGGDRIKNIADAAAGGSGGVYPWVLSAEDSHASFPGSTTDDCGGNSVGISDDCLSPGNFTNIKQADDGLFLEAEWRYLALTGNIGEPYRPDSCPPSPATCYYQHESGFFNSRNWANPDGILEEVWNGSEIEFRAEQDSGHGLNFELLSDHSNSTVDNKFCGWKCPTRTASGNCGAGFKEGGFSVCTTPWKNILMWDKPIPSSNPDPLRFAPDVPYSR